MSLIIILVVMRAYMFKNTQARKIYVSWRYAMLPLNILGNKKHAKFFSIAVSGYRIYLCVVTVSALHFRKIFVDDISSLNLECIKVKFHESNCTFFWVNNWESALYFCQLLFSSFHLRKLAMLCMNRMGKSNYCED